MTVNIERAFEKVFSEGFAAGRKAEADKWKKEIEAELKEEKAYKIQSDINEFAIRLLNRLGGKKRMINEGFEEHAKSRGFNSVKEMREYFFGRKEGLVFLSIKKAFEAGVLAETDKCKKEIEKRIADLERESKEHAYLDIYADLLFCNCEKCLEIAKASNELDDLLVRLGGKKDE